MNVLTPKQWPRGTGEMARMIRAHRWAGTPLGPIEQWPQSLRTAVDTCLGSGLTSLVWWGPDLIQIYNDAAIRDLRDRHPRALGAPARETWRDIWGNFGHRIEHVLASGEPVIGQDLPVILPREGVPEMTYFTFGYSALRDESGSIAGVFVIIIDTTAKLEAEAARQESDRRLKELAGATQLSADFRALFEAAPTPLMVLEPSELRIVAVNEAYLRTVSATREALLNRRLFGIFPDYGDDGYAAGLRDTHRSLEKVIATGRTDVMPEQRYPVPGPAEEGGGLVERRWCLTNTPVLAGDGSVALIILHVEDVTERRAAEEALRKSEERFRRIVECARDYAILIISTDGLITDWFPGAESVFGWTAEEVVGEPLSIIFTPEDRGSGVPELEMRIAAAESVAPDVRWHQRKDGRRVYIEGTLMALHDPDGRISAYLKIGQDVTERMRAEEHLQTLLNELQHRVRNILAMIRSVVRRTARTSENVAEYARHLDGRISALVRTQALLTRDPGAGVDLQNLILDELQAQATQDSQFVCEGPDVLLSPKAAEVLTLAIHELATNSVKYGALSRIDGDIAVRWAVEAANEPWLRLTWSESRVPNARTPRRHGFGTELITRRVPYELRGRGSVEFGKERIAATIEFPLVHADSMLQTHA